MRMSYLRMNHSTTNAVILNAMRFENTQIYKASTGKIARSLLMRNILSLLMADVLVTPKTKLWNMTTLVTIDQIARKVIRYPHCRKTLAYQSKLNEHLKGHFRATFKCQKFDNHSNKIFKKCLSICIYSWDWDTGMMFYQNTHQWSHLTLLCSRNVYKAGKNVDGEKKIFDVMPDEVDEVDEVWDEEEAYKDLMRLRTSTLITMSPFHQEIVIFMKPWCQIKSSVLW